MRGGYTVGASRSMLSRPPKEVNMRRGVVIVALVGGFVGATTLPAAAQYWEDNAVGLNIGFGPPVYSAPVYGAYAADYYAAPPAAAYAYSAPAACPCAAAGYGYGGSYGAYGYARPYAGYAGPYATGYAAGPGYSYGPSYAYEPGYTYSSSSVTVSRGYREGIRSQNGIRSARAYGGNETMSSGVRERGTSVRTGSNIRSTSTARPRASAANASARGGETVGRATSNRARGEPRGGASMQSGEMNGQSQGNMGR
jgi:hypothetical protein